ncbi:MAG: 4-hydroxy-tetrahydrodipicolinate synthase [Clostridiales bacterium]|nr:MAG: 4-hydroxy-tetrahydrodipicolinate synthase [Clostridiales bacterium]
MSIFEGSATALITPFTDSGVDYGRLKAMLDFQIGNGTDALLICGTTGEPATMTADERKKTLETAIEYVNGRVPVIAGAGANNTKTAVEWSLYSKQAGADALLHVTPYYNKCSDEGLYRHYMTIADSTDLPVIAYNVPSRTGVNMKAEVLARLAEHENIAAMKEASGDISHTAKMMALCGDRVDFYSGNDDQTIPIMSLGGKGVISVLSNVMPKEVHEMAKAYLDGDTKRAAKMQLCLKPIMDAMFMATNPIPVKTALLLMGLDSGILRLPLCEMSGQETEKLSAVMQKYDLLK